LTINTLSDSSEWSLGSAYIIKENALKVSKILPSLYQISISHEQGRNEGVVPDGFVHVTKNVLEGRSAVVLNKANLTVVDEVKVYICTTVHKKVDFFHYMPNDDNTNSIVMLFLEKCFESFWCT